MQYRVDGVPSEIQQLIDQLHRTRCVLEKEEIQALAHQPEPDVVAKWIKGVEAQRQHANQRFTIMLLGEFSSGKSTVLNVLLGLTDDKKHLPMRDDPTTALPVRLRFKKEGDPEALWILNNGDEVPKKWQDAINESTQKLAQRSDIKEVVLFLDNDILRHADFLDMPGTGTAWFKQHTEITQDYVANSESIIWVIGSEEPSREGLRDYLTVKKRNIDIFVIFNAWGALDPEVDVEMYVEQDEIEDTVREDFPEAFNSSPGFRVYGRKAFESAQSGQTEDWGFSDLRRYLIESFSKSYIDLARRRRENVARQVRLTAEEIAQEAREHLEQWYDSESRLSEDALGIKALLSRLNVMEFQARAQVRDLAGNFAAEIVKFMIKQCRSFLDAHINVLNFELYKKAITKKRRDELEAELNRILKQEYLKLDEPNNWLAVQIEDFIEEAWTVLEANWRRFLEEIDLDPSGIGEAATAPELPFDELKRAAMEGIRNVLLQVGGILAVMGILVAIPGGQTVDAIAIGLTLIVSLFKDPMARTRDIAMRRIRNELEINEPGLKNNLVKEAMNHCHGTLKSKFELLTTTQREEVKKQMGNIRAGRTTLQELASICDDIAFQDYSGSKVA